jgi:hypothetical protein
MDVTFISGRAEINPGDTSTHDPVGGDGRVCAGTGKSGLALPDKLSFTPGADAALTKIKTQVS